MPNSSASAAAVVSDDTSSGGGSNGVTLKKGPWTTAEDAILMEYVKRYGEGNWNAVQKNSGLSRCGKSCRLRWANHLRPNLKKGSFSPDEERLILELHAKLGNKWARMAAQLPGRTDNEIKNYWNTRVKRRQRVGLPLYPQDVHNQSSPFHHHQSAASQSSFITPISISDPINNSPLLGRHSSPILGFKRFRANTMGYSPPFPAPRTPTLPLSSSLYTNNFSSHFLPPQNFQFDTNNYNFGLPTMLQSGFDPSGLFGPGSAFSVKMGLPSSQIDETTLDDSSKFCSSLACTNSGLLDALLQEAEAMGGKDQARQEGHNQKCGAIDEFLNNTQLSNSAVGAKPALGSASQWDEASSAQSSPGGQIKTEATLNVINNHVDDDELSSLLSSIPTTTMVSELYYNEGANALTMTDDNTGPSISATNSYMNNELAALCAWNNLPGMSC